MCLIGCLFFLVIGCSPSAPGQSEETPVECQDQLDNDGDGKTDCADEACAGYDFCRNTPQTEDTATACQDKQDNDNDGNIDCDDASCMSFSFCIKEETSAAQCQDKQDNDNDGKIDCEDSDCLGFTFCATASKEETSAAQCQDKQDNDEDGKTDCDDEDCKGFTFCSTNAKVETSAVQCQDKLDNDSDGKIDCDDPDCKGFTFCTTVTVEDSPTLCQDTKDNDGDGKTDCDDLDCQVYTFCQKVEDTASLCQDKQDNDGDGKTDCEDSDCQGFTFCQKVEISPAQCQDTQDNDGDGKTDCDDPDCQAYVFCQKVENNANLCQDKKDNDNDGKIDCDDPECKVFTFCQGKVENTPSLCQDKQDNDGDGKTDCDDPDCSGYFFCQKVENTASLCQDKQDNDGDGKTDCDDIDCQGFTFCQNNLENSPALCQDKKDNDGDGKTDCDDSDCQGYFFCQKLENTASLCQDNQDNDGDGKTDCDDTDCQGFTFCIKVENNSSLCQDKKDNDGDGKTDCDDTDCQNFFFCSKVENSAATCSDKQDNDGDGKTDCDDPGCQVFTFCQQSTLESSLGACQDKKDNDGDGKTDCQDSDCWHWYFCGHYNGFPVQDAWGATWDGTPRPATTWKQASDTCKALGGRLPTATELHRNNTQTGQGSISTPRATEYLWTFITTYRLDRKVTVRLSDGNTSNQIETNNSQYRCIWPSADYATNSKGFDSYRCNGKPGDTCQKVGPFQNIDKIDRPKLDYAAAANECSFYGASLPNLRDWTTAIHNGLENGSDGWLWLAKAMYWHSGGHGAAQIRWKGKGTPRWYYYNSANFGSVTYTSNLRAFRCIGYNDLSQLTVPSTSTTCSGGCMKVDARRSTILIDKQDRGTANYRTAFDACRKLKADVPKMSEFTEALHMGLPGGTNQWNWTAESMYWYNGGYGHPNVRWTNNGTEDWSFNGWGTKASLAAYTTNNRNYRCIWRSKKPALPTCKTGEVMQWQSGKLACVAGAKGTSNGNATAEIIDDWGNAWDVIERQATTYSGAEAKCKSLGGRLPTASELYRGRASSDNTHKALGATTSTNYLWTTTPNYRTDNNEAVRVSDGATNHYNILSATRPFRCIWPAKKSDILHGANCYGPPGSECFQGADGLVMDKYDRPKVTAVGAYHDCRQEGGHVPTTREMTRLMHQALPNGTNRWLYMGEPMYWYNGGYGYSLARWTGAGTVSWDYTNTSNYGAVGYGYNKYNFRCVYTPYAD
tara:strand:+ start:10558 stop:14262 length:3705 start_codon:yes stop_codon:yes gene_type:complete